MSAHDVATPGSNGPPESGLDTSNGLEFVQQHKKRREARGVTVDPPKSGRRSRKDSSTRDVRRRGTDRTRDR
jgi:hypothetical protein